MILCSSNQIIRRCQKYRCKNFETIRKHRVTGLSRINNQLQTGLRDIILSPDPRQQQYLSLCTTKNGIHTDQVLLDDNEGRGNGDLQFGTRMYVERSAIPYSIDKPISKFIQFGLKEKYDKQSFATTNVELSSSELISNSSRSDHKKTNSNPDFSVTCLGTGSGTFTDTRATSCTALRVGGSRVMLFDAGEGLQRQLLFSKILRKNMMQLKQIFITHLHGDHIFGLIGILLKFQVAAKAAMSEESTTTQSFRNKNKRMQKHVIEVYGPPGLYNYISINLALSFSKLNFITIVVYELTGGTHDPGKETKVQTKGDNTGKIFKKRHRHTHSFIYPEFRNPNLIRKVIPMNPDGVWVLESFDEIESSKSKNLSRKQTQKCSIQAAEVDHLPGVQTFGYVVEEAPLEPNIDVEKAQKLGLCPSPKYRLLKKGQAVSNDTNDKIIQPNDVLFPNKRSRKFALLGDNYSISEPMLKLIQNVDVLVHEATIVGENKGDKEALERGHATPAMAGEVSRDCNAKVLLLNHISCSLQMEDIDEMVIKHAKEANKNVSQIVASYDFLQLNIPRGGFDSF